MTEIKLSPPHYHVFGGDEYYFEKSLQAQYLGLLTLDEVRQRLRNGALEAAAFFVGSPGGALEYVGDLEQQIEQIDAETRVIQWTLADQHTQQIFVLHTERQHWQPAPPTSRAAEFKPRLAWMTGENPPIHVTGVPYTGRWTSDPL